MSDIIQVLEYNKMEILVLLIVITTLGLLIVSLLKKVFSKYRKEYIEQYIFSNSLIQKLKQQYPQLNTKEIKSVFEGLRSYFQICNIVGDKEVATVSVVVASALSEFIRDYKEYKLFCAKSLGYTLIQNSLSNEYNLEYKKIKRAWFASCELEKLNSSKTKRLPFLFSLDERLKIKNGNVYPIEQMQKLKHIGFLEDNIREEYKGEKLTFSNHADTGYR